MVRSVSTFHPTKGTVDQSNSEGHEVNVPDGVGYVDEEVLTFEKDVGTGSYTSMQGKNAPAVFNLSEEAALNHTDLLEESPEEGLRETGSHNTSLNYTINNASVLNVDERNISLGTESISWNLSEKLLEDNQREANATDEGRFLINNSGSLLNLSGHLALNETEGLLDEELDDVNETGVNSSFDYMNISAEAHAENRSAGEEHDGNASLGNASMSWNVSGQLFQGNQSAANESEGGVLNNSSSLYNLSGHPALNETEGLLDEELDDVNETGVNTSLDYTNKTAEAHAENRSGGEEHDGNASLGNASLSWNVSEQLFQGNQSAASESEEEVLNNSSSLLNLSGHLALNETEGLLDEELDDVNETGVNTGFNYVNISAAANAENQSAGEEHDGNTSLGNASLSLNVSEQLFQGNQSAANESEEEVLNNSSSLLNLSGHLALNETEGLLDEERHDVNETGVNSSFDYMNISAEAHAENRSAGEEHDGNASLGNASMSWNVSGQLFQGNQSAANESEGGVLNNSSSLYNLSGRLALNETEGLLDEELDDVNETGVNTSFNYVNISAAANAENQSAGEEHDGNTSLGNAQLFQGNQSAANESEGGVLNNSSSRFNLSGHLALHETEGLLDEELDDVNETGVNTSFNYMNISAAGNARNQSAGEEHDGNTSLGNASLSWNVSEQLFQGNQSPANESEEEVLNNSSSLLNLSGHLALNETKGLLDEERHDVNETGVNSSFGYMNISAEAHAENRSDGEEKDGNASLGNASMSRNVSGQLFQGNQSAANESEGGVLNNSSSRFNLSGHLALNETEGLLDEELDDVNETAVNTSLDYMNSSPEAHAENRSPFEAHDGNASLGNASLSWNVSEQLFQGNQSAANDSEEEVLNDSSSLLNLSGHLALNETDGLLDDQLDNVNETGLNSSFEYMNTSIKANGENRSADEEHEGNSSTGNASISWNESEQSLGSNESDAKGSEDAVQHGKSSNLSNLSGPLGLNETEGLLDEELHGLNETGLNSSFDYMNISREANAENRSAGEEHEGNSSTGNASISWNESEQSLGSNESDAKGSEDAVQHGKSSNLSNLSGPLGLNETEGLLDEELHGLNETGLNSSFDYMNISREANAENRSAGEEHEGNSSTGNASISWNVSQQPFVFNESDAKESGEAVQNGNSSNLLNLSGPPGLNETDGVLDEELDDVNETGLNSSFEYMNISKNANAENSSADEEHEENSSTGNASISWNVSAQSFGSNESDAKESEEAVEHGNSSNLWNLSGPPGLNETEGLLDEVLDEELDDANDTGLNRSLDYMNISIEANAENRSVGEEHDGQPFGSNESDAKESEEAVEHGNSSNLWNLSGRPGPNETEGLLDEELDDANDTGLNRSFDYMNISIEANAVNSSADEEHEGNTSMGNASISWNVSEQPFGSNESDAKESEEAVHHGNGSNLLNLSGRPGLNETEGLLDEELDDANDTGLNRSFDYMNISMEANAENSSADEEHEGNTSMGNASISWNVSEQPFGSNESDAKESEEAVEHGNSSNLWNLSGRPGPNETEGLLDEELDDANDTGLNRSFDYMNISVEANAENSSADEEHEGNTSMGNASISWNVSEQLFGSNESDAKESEEAVEHGNRSNLWNLSGCPGPNETEGLLDEELDDANDTGLNRSFDYMNISVEANAENSSADEEHEGNTSMGNASISWNVSEQLFGSNESDAKESEEAVEHGNRSNLWNLSGRPGPNETEGLLDEELDDANDTGLNRSFDYMNIAVEANAENSSAGEEHEGNTSMGNASMSWNVSEANEGGQDWNASMSMSQKEAGA